MTTTLYETIRRIAADELAAHRGAALAVVQESHPHADASDTDNYACTVVLRDTGLVLRRVPVATARVGTVAVPEPGQLVLVAFVGGDLAAPVIVGCLYTDAHRPPVNAAGVHVTHLPPGADDAEAVHLELRSAGERSIVLTLGDGLALTVADADPAVSLDVGGKATLTIAKDGTVELTSQGAVTLKGAEVTVEAQGALTLKGATVDIN